MKTRPSSAPDESTLALRVLTPDEEQEGLRVDRFLADELGDLSRTRIQSLMDDGLITLGGKKLKSSYKVSAGDEITVRLPAPELPDIEPEDIPLDILYEDSDVLIVNKPKGMTVHPAPGHLGGTLVNAVMWHCGESLSGINGVLRPGIVHRIDKNTTGALIVCKNDAAHRSIAAQLKEHSITRRYLGVVIGAPREDESVIEGNIGRDPKERKRMAVVHDGGKPAVTYVKVLERFNGYSLCEFRLETGRTHQIRVHMSHTGHPLLGDDVYGGKRSGFALEGQTLHAGIIGFIHPSTGEYMEFTAPLPDYFEDLLARLRSMS